VISQIQTVSSHKLNQTRPDGKNQPRLVHFGWSTPQALTGHHQVFLQRRTDCSAGRRARRATALRGWSLRIALPVDALPAPGDKTVDFLAEITVTCVESRSRWMRGNSSTGLSLTSMEIATPDTPGGGSTTIPSSPS
jgi:hypothetical protein